MRRPLVELLRGLGADRGRLGFESASASQPSSYAEVHIYQGDLRRLLEDSGLSVLVPADELLARLRSRPTPGELQRIRTACRIAEQAFETGVLLVRPGQLETEVAAGFRRPLHSGWPESSVSRADGFVFCMSGIHSAEAYGAYARSRSKPISAGELLLVHCNSYIDGYWTDITRTYCLGEPDRRQDQMYQAVFAAREAALQAIRPGVMAAAVDRVARAELEQRGFGDEFKHPAGHGVGFAAIDHNARPRLHPRSTDVLETGMVFNVEPAIYTEGVQGLRHCDMVMVTESGAEVLTPFQAIPAELLLPSAGEAPPVID